MGKVGGDQFFLLLFRFTELRGGGGEGVVVGHGGVRYGMRALDV